MYARNTRISPHEPPAPPRPCLRFPSFPLLVFRANHFFCAPITCLRANDIVLRKKRKQRPQASAKGGECNAGPREGPAAQHLEGDDAGGIHGRGIAERASSKHRLEVPERQPHRLPLPLLCVEAPSSPVTTTVTTTVTACCAA